MDPTVSAALTSISNKQVFQRPMSKNARKLLSNILSWARGPSGKCFKGPHPTTDCYKAFAEKYHPIKFEDACHRFELSTFAPLVDFKPSTSENLLNVMMLKSLDSEPWVINSNLKVNVGRVGCITTDRAVALYDWLTTYYLMTDFTATDLNKISEMSGENYDFNVIKSEASKILDTDKRNVAYLYAIVRDVTSRGEVVRSQERAMGSIYDEKLRQVFSYGGEKIQHIVPDKSADWRHEREWLDILSDMGLDD
jgi:hypothetical protein